MKLSLMLHAAAFFKKQENHGKGMARGCLQNLSVPRAAFVGKPSLPFLPTHKSDLFYIYKYINTPHTLGKAWATLPVSHGCPRLGMCSQEML